MGLAQGPGGGASQTPLLANMTPQKKISKKVKLAQLLYIGLKRREKPFCAVKVTPEHTTVDVFRILP